MKIFVSYSRISKAHAEELIRSLKRLGHEVWYDQEIVGGNKWWSKILENIRNCQVFIFAHSEHTGLSEACTYELDYAQRLNRPIIPVILEGEKSEYDIPSTISGLHYIDYRLKDANAALDLFSAINEVSPNVPLPNPLPTPPTTPRLTRPKKNEADVSSAHTEIIQSNPTEVPKINILPFFWLLLFMYIGFYGWFSFHVNESRRIAMDPANSSPPIIVEGIQFKNGASASHHLLIQRFKKIYPRIEPAGNTFALMILGFFFGASGRIISICRQVLTGRIFNMDRALALGSMSGGFVGLIFFGGYFVLAFWFPDFNNLSMATILIFLCMIGGYYEEKLFTSVLSNSN